MDAAIAGRQGIVVEMTCLKMMLTIAGGRVKLGIYFEKSTLSLIAPAVFLT